MASYQLLTPNFNALGTPTATVTTGAGPWIQVDPAVRIRVILHTTTGVTAGTVKIESSDTNNPSPTTPFLTDTLTVTAGDAVTVASYFLNEKAFGPWVRLNVGTTISGGGAPGVYGQLQAWR